MKRTTKTKIFAVIMMMTIVFALAACGSKDAKEAEEQSGEKTALFPEFTATDYDGNKLDTELFKDNAVTVLNFWFNGCPVCVNEMPDLEKMNTELKTKGGELIGVNAEIPYNEGLLDESKEILSRQGATYRNMYISLDSEGGKLVSRIQAFPTTIVVNRNGEMVGSPIVGALLGTNRDELDKRIDEIIKADAGK